MRIPGWVIGWGFIALCVWGVVSCHTSEGYQASLREEEAERKALATPHRWADGPNGCVVYRFKANERFNFYTECPNSKVSTETAIEVCTGYGKQRSCRTETSSIQTVK